MGVSAGQGRLALVKAMNLEPPILALRALGLGQRRPLRLSRSSANVGVTALQNGHAETRPQAGRESPAPARRAAMERSVHFTLTA